MAIRQKFVYLFSINAAPCQRLQKGTRKVRRIAAKWPNTQGSVKCAAKNALT